ncbi:MAG: hypothetical protein ACRDSH_24010 [Pseudonocardiaceae bacterium]
MNATAALDQGTMSLAQVLDSEDAMLRKAHTDYAVMLTVAGMMALMALVAVLLLLA